MKKRRPKFPLEMDQGVEVRSLDELRDNFSLARVLVYVSSGKLVNWLKDWYYNDIADEIEALDIQDGELPKKVCEIFDITYDEDIAINMERAEERNRKLSVLKEYTTDKKFVDVVDNIAFTQDDLYDLLDEQLDTIYLCGEKFAIPISKRGMTYIGVNNPIVVIDEKDEVNWVEKGITLSDVRLIDYSILSNNLNKAYIIYEDDPIPEGVAENGSVEKFIENCYDALGMNKDDELEIEISPKVDGVLINTEIKKGKLKKPTLIENKNGGMYIHSLEGYQIAGEDNDELGAQYEVFVSKDIRDKTEILARLNKDYTSNKAAACEIINRMVHSDVPEFAEYLYFYPIASAGLDKSYRGSIEYIQRFAKLPNDILERKCFRGNRDVLLDIIEKYFKEVIKERNKLSYYIDGIIITVTKKQDKIGREGSTKKFQIALTFAPTECEAVVVDVYLSNNAKFGYKTIMAKLEEPIYLNGFKYNRIPVLSAEIFESLDLHRGDKVVVKKTGDVIPTILRPAGSKPGYGIKLKPSKNCQCCLTPLVIENKKLRCVNPECKSNIIGKLTHFFESSDLKNSDRSTAKLLVEKLNVKNIADLFSIAREQFETIGYQKKTKSFIDELKESLQVMRDYELLSGIAIDGIQEDTAKKILSVINIDNLDAYNYSDMVEAIRSVEEINVKAWEYARGIIQNREDIKFLLRYIDPRRTNFSNVIKLYK